jgi:hypothetical protein
MQASIWMAYLNSIHFSEKLSYKILFISSYGLKDMNFARCKYLQEFQKTKIEAGTFSHPQRRRPAADPRDRGC